MKNEAGDQVCLMTASVLSVLGFYLTYVWFRLQSFKPLIDRSGFVYEYQLWLRPEIEVQLYGLGIISIVFLSPIIFFILKRLLIKSCYGLFVRLIILLDLLIFLMGGLLGTLITAQQIFLIFVSLGIIFFFSLRKLLFLTKIIDWAAAFISVVVVVIITAFLFLTPVFSDKSVAALFNTYGFRFYNGLPKWELITAILITVTIFLAWIRNRKRLNKFPDLIIFPIIVICLLVFSPFDKNHVFAISCNDYSYFLGPINDVLHGKTLLVNNPSQYGLLSMYFLALPFKFLAPLSFNNLFWLYFAATASGYFLTYLIMRRLIGGVFLPMLGLFLILLQNYYAQLDNLLCYPQTGLLRFGWWVIIALCLAKKKFLLEIILIGIAVFWAADAGLYILGAYLLTTVFREFIKQNSITFKIKSVAVRLLLIFVGLEAFFLGISFYTLLRSGFWPNWTMFIGDANIYLSGFGLVPIPLIGLYLFFILLYLILLIYLLSKAFATEHKNSENDLLVLVAFITFYGIMQFTYFMGRSHPNNLHHVVIPFVVLFCWAVNKIRVSYQEKKFSHIDLPNKMFFMSLTVLALLLFSLVFVIGFKNMVATYQVRDTSMPKLDEFKDKPEFSRSISYINGVLSGLTGSSRRVALISRTETFFLVQTNSVNIIDSNNLSYFNMLKDVRVLEKQLINSNPEYIFVDHINTSSQVEMLKRAVEKNYHLKENIGFLDVLERN